MPVLQVLDADPHVQQDIVPYLKHRSLRSIVKSLTNDQDTGFADWASNPQVLNTLAEAKRLLDEGRMTEDEMEAALLAQLKVFLSLKAKGLTKINKSTHINK